MSGITFQVSSKISENVKNAAFDINKVAVKKPLDLFLKKNQDKQNYNRRFIMSNIRESEAKLIDVGMNSFVGTCLEAYSSHHNLILRPDDVWLAIIVQFSHYINGHAEELRSKFVDHEGKKNLTVYGTGNLSSADYRNLCSQMSQKISENIKDASVREWIVPGFSTTNEDDIFAANVILMSSVQSYFDLNFALLCELPSVTLLGTTEDWQVLREKASRLLEFDNVNHYVLEWTNLLFPVLDQFVASSRGNHDIAWWNKIATMKSGGSGATWLSGWLTVFCMFTEDGKWLGDQRAEWLKIDLSKIPRGYVCTSVKINDNGKMYDAEIYAGQFHAKIGPDIKTISPSTGIALFVKE